MSLTEALKLEQEIWNGNLMAYGISDADLVRLSNLGWRWEAIAAALPTAFTRNSMEIEFLVKLHKLATQTDE